MVFLHGSGTHEQHRDTRMKPHTSTLTSLDSHSSWGHGAMLPEMQSGWDPADLHKEESYRRQAHKCHNADPSRGAGSYTGRSGSRRCRAQHPLESSGRLEEREGAVGMWWAIPHAGCCGVSRGYSRVQSGKPW